MTRLCNFQLSRSRYIIANKLTALTFCYLLMQCLKLGGTTLPRISCSGVESCGLYALISVAIPPCLPREVYCGLPEQPEEQQGATERVARPTSSRFRDRETQEAQAAMPCYILPQGERTMVFMLILVLLPYISTR